MNKAIVVILLAVVLDAIGVGLIMPILPSLLREVSHTNNVASQYGMLLAVYAAMQFLFSPVLGALSDRFGRRPVLLTSLAGAAIDYLVMAIAPTMWVLVVGRIVAGVTGANMVVATAYIADITPEDQRAKRYGYMSACFGLGLIAGPMLGGLLGDISVRHPFLLAAALNGLNFLVGCFALPESHRGERRALALKALNPFASLRWAATLTGALSLLVVFVEIEIAGQLPASLWVIYGEDRFGWDTHMVGVSLAAFGAMHAAIQVLCTGPITARLGERRALLIGIVAESAGYGLLAFATRGWMAFALLPLLAMGGIARPALQALLSRQVSERQQGELQGTLVSLTSLVAIAGPLAATSLYAATSGSWPGWVWIVGAALYLLCLPALRRSSGRRPAGAEAVS
jgi:DHA1 family tetracycline resistance protein-like MFS transporter